MKEKKDIISTKENNEQKDFFDALRNAETKAIRQLAAKISFGAKQAARNAQLSAEDTEELINDALVITIKNIRLGKFQFQNISPTSYALGVIRKLIANRIRSKKPATAPLSGTENLVDFSPDEYFRKKELEQLLKRLLSKLGATCQKIIQLKYYEGRKDAEIINQKLVDFSSINSLKSKRSQCLKNLIQIAKGLDKSLIFG